MNKLLLIFTLSLLITGLGAGSSVSEAASNHGDDTSTVAIGAQHEESGSEEVAEIAVKGGTISNTIIAGIIEKDQVNHGTVVAFIATGDHLDDRKQVNILVNDEENPGWQSVTIPGKSIEQDSYREGNEASHEKKIQGQPSFDDLEMERGVKPGATELHDWIKDIQAGKADSARKEIAVKIQNEEGKSVTQFNFNVKEYNQPELDSSAEGDFAARKGRKEMNAIDVRRADVHDPDGDNTPIIKGIEKDQVKRGMVVAAAMEGKVKFFNEEKGYASERSARKGRNPQTGKEIKIPARDEDGGDGAMVTVPIEVSELAMEGKVKFFNEEKGYAIIKDNENGEEYFVHVTGPIDEIRDEDDVSFKLREGRKGMNAVDVRRTD